MKPMIHDPQNTTKNLKIEQRESNKNWGMNSGRDAVSAPLVAPVMLLLNDKNNIRYGNRFMHQYK
jgi:hypothetical protein